MISTQLSQLTVLFTLMIGCGTWAGNPKNPDEGGSETTNAQVTLDIEGNSNGTALLAQDLEVTNSSGTVTGTVSLTVARVSLKKIKLRAEDGGGDSAEFKGPYIVDLLTNNVTPSIDSINIPSGNYRDIKLQLAKLEEGEASSVVSSDDPLIGNSIHLKGTYSSDTSGDSSFEMFFDLDEEFFIPLGDSTTNIAIEEGAVNKILITFALYKWFDFQGQDESLEDIAGSSIVLDKDTEEQPKKVREAIKDNIKDSAEFDKKEQ